MYQHTFIWAWIISNTRQILKILNWPCDEIDLTVYRTNNKTVSTETSFLYSGQDTTDLNMAAKCTGTGCQVVDYNG